MIGQTGERIRVDMKKSEKEGGGGRGREKRDGGMRNRRRIRKR